MDDCGNTYARTRVVRLLFSRCQKYKASTPFKAAEKSLVAMSSIFTASKLGLNLKCSRRRSNFPPRAVLPCCKPTGLQSHQAQLTPSHDIRHRAVESQCDWRENRTLQ